MGVEAVGFHALGCGLWIEIVGFCGEGIEAVDCRVE